MASSVYHFIVNFIFYDILSVKRQNSFVTSFKRDIKKNKTEKNALFSPRSCTGGILVKQISVYTRHKKLHYIRFTHKETTTVLRLRLSDSFEFTLKTFILCCSKDITLLLYGFYSFLYWQRVISPLNLS